MSPYTILVLIIKKPDGGLRIYIDYRALNTLTIWNRNTLLLVKETLARLYTARFYSKFNIIVTFNEIRIKKKNEEKIAFLTRYGLFEYIFISFSLYNVLSTF